MYIPPGFSLITCELVDETALQSWAAVNGGIWYPAVEGHYGRRHAYAEWDLGPYQGMEAKCKMLTEEYSAEWIPRERMHKPPQSVIDVGLSEELDQGNEQCVLVIQAMFARWDSYVYDRDIYDWVSTLLRKVLPSERIIRFERPPPGPAPAWIWVHGKYTKNEAYYDNRDAAAAGHENQL